MKQIAITIIVGTICILSAIAYDTIFNLVQDKRQLQLEVEGYKLLIQQQEYRSVKEQIQLRKQVRKLNEMMTLCVSSEPIIINRLQYRCYHVYEI